MGRKSDLTKLQEVHSGISSVELVTEEAREWLRFIAVEGLFVGTGFTLLVLTGGVLKYEDGNNKKVERFDWEMRDALGEAMNSAGELLVQDLEIPFVGINLNVFKPLGKLLVPLLRLMERKGDAIWIKKDVSDSTTWKFVPAPPGGLTNEFKGANPADSYELVKKAYYRPLPLKARGIIVLVIPGMIRVLVGVVSSVGSFSPSK